MIEFTISFILGFLSTLTSLAIGYSLGKHQTVTPPDVTRKINQIFSKVVPPSDIGPIERPTAQDNYYRDNPKQALEDDIMTKEFDQRQNG